MFLDELGSRGFDIGNYAVDLNERGNLYADIEPLDIGVGLTRPVGVVGLSNSLLDGVEDPARVAVNVSCVGLGPARTHACVLAGRGDLRRVYFEPLDIGHIGGYFIGVLRLRVRRI